LDVALANGERLIKPESKHVFERGTSANYGFLHVWELTLVYADMLTALLTPK